jgi:hypothetical protein
MRPIIRNPGAVGFRQADKAANPQRPASLRRLPCDPERGATAGNIGIAIPSVSPWRF